MSVTSYLNLLLEEFNPEELCKQIESTVKEIFPKSYVSCKVKTGLGKHINFTFMLGKDSSEWENGIAGNDPMLVGVIIHLDDIHDDILPIHLLQHSLTVKPTQKYMAQGRVKLPFRQVKLPANKVVDYFKTGFTRSKEILKKNLDNMMDDDRKLAETKI